MKWMWRWWIGLVIALHGASAQTLTPEDVIKGEIIVRLKPGRTIDTARAIANLINAEATPILVQDTYRLRLRNIHQLSDEDALRAVQSAIQQLAQHPDVLYVDPNYRCIMLDRPNDPLFPEQWALQMMRLPAAWDIQKGDPRIRMAFIDDNFQRSHPDLRNVFDALSRNFAADPPNTNIDPETPGFSHGTSTVGVAAAITDNGIGIAGLTWQRALPDDASIKPVVALKVEARADTSFLDYSNILEAYQYVIDNASQIFVLNMSYGRLFYSSHENSLIQAIYQRGIVPVAAAGNFNSDIPMYPANYPNVVSVAAVGRTGARASYSNYGNIDLAAPGGDQARGYTDGVLTTSSTVLQYEYVQGTSYAAPYVTAAIALLLAAGVPRHASDAVEPAAVTILKETADPRGRSVPDPELGFGIIDLEQALRGAGRVNIAFLEPEAGASFDSRRVRVQVEVRRVLGNNPANIRRVLLNDQPLPRDLWEPTARVDVERKLILLDFVVEVPGAGAYTIVVEAIGQDERLGTNSVRFAVRARQQMEGLAMFSTPYQLERTPEELFGADVILARYIPSAGTYARYTVANRDPRASFNPPGVGVRPDGSDRPTPPRGLGYFLRITSPASLLGNEVIDLNTAYLIPLEEGWNMIGNPFPFNVPWAACEVEITGLGGQRQRITLEEAVRREIIRPQIYRYVPLTGEYTWRTAPLGELLAWQAHWVKALKPCTLVVPPVGSKRSRAETEPSRAAPNPTDGWLLRLIARCGDREDANNFIGTASQAQEGIGNEDVEKPPAFESYVALVLREPRSRSALAQDVRPASKRTQRWELEVTTDQPNAEVTLQWVQEVPLPRGVRLTLIDQATGERVSMQQHSAYRFRTDEQSRRRLVIEAQPARTARLQITNISITQSRGGQFVIQYALSDAAEVQVLVQDATGRTIARLQGGNRTAGVSTVSWNGRTDAGVAVPPGAYHLQIVATTAEGETVRVVRPLIVTR
ncbi:MAG: S8 family serine peptidase [Fimbriimonadales bacterium]|nr:S8 family serine peptidase [Fimbriimonadales bacterium]MDW8051637.1 S8 family serine peptidase [Armatimonadota bacterium]